MIRRLPILLLSVALAVPAHAGEPPAPSEANEAGKLLFAEGDFEGAHALWAEAFASARGADEQALAINLGIASFRLERWADAFYYFTFAGAAAELGQHPFKGHQKVTRALQDLRTRLSQSHGRLEVVTRPSPNAEVCVGEGSVTCRKAPAVWPLPPGLHRVRVALRGDTPLSETVDIQPGRTARLDLLLPGEPPPADCTAVIAGGHHTCLLTDEGRLRCTGDNRRGQLGADRSDWYLRRPLETVGIDHPIRDAATSGSHSCAVTATGKVFCWGEGSKGRLGDGIADRGPSWRPVPVSGLPSDAQSVTVGRDHACAVLGTDAVVCWGANDHGQLGSDTNGIPSTSALPVDGLPGGVAALAAGYGFTCALIDDGRIFCWGGAPLGPSNTPVPLAFLPDGVTGIAAGDRHLALIAERTLYTISSKEKLRRRDGERRALHVRAGGDRTCSLNEGGRIRCAQGREVVTVDPYEPGDPPAVDLAVGPTHTCVVLEDGRYRCVGEETFGQLGR